MIAQLSFRATKEMMVPKGMRCAGEMMVGYGKLGGIALRLSLALTYLNWASEYDAHEPYEVDYVNLSRAINLTLATLGIDRKTFVTNVINNR